MKALASTGLVRIQFKRNHRGYREGDLADFSPQEAEALAILEVAIAAPIPKGAKTITVNEPALEMVTAPKPKPHTGIPDDWETLHALQQRKIAEQIKGAPVKAEEVAPIIRDELARQAAE